MDEHLIVKRHGHVEKFDERKLYASVYSSALATRIVEEKAEEIADKLCREVKAWLKKHKGATTDKLFEASYEILEGLDPRVALMYKTHRDIL